MCFGAFMLVGGGGDNDLMVGFGAIFFLLAAALFIIAPIMLGLKYPDYDILTGETDRSAKFKM